MDAAAALIRWTEVRRREFVIVHFVALQKRNQHHLLKIFVFRNSLRNLACGSYFLLNCTNWGILLYMDFSSSGNAIKSSSALTLNLASSLSLRTISLLTAAQSCFKVKL